MREEERNKVIANQVVKINSKLLNISNIRDESACHPAWLQALPHHQDTIAVIAL